MKENKRIESNKKKCIHELEKNFENILNDYSLDTEEKEKAMRRYVKIFNSNN